MSYRPDLTPVVESNPPKVKRMRHRGGFFARWTGAGGFLARASVPAVLLWVPVFRFTVRFLVARRGAGD
ncbi:hypothetical protein AAFO92_05390 [Roseovarius sp. CAU 1744]|uniref:hypothetical protein n=1 Tax=Roseovarius sp. CAU 1744 TaxID=3140368 RepID=UPI00325ABB71